MKYQGTAHPCAQHNHACSTPTPASETLTMPRVPPHRAIAQRHNALPAYTQQLQRTCHTQHNVHRTIPRTTKQTCSAIHKSTAHTAPGAAHTARTHAATHTPSIHQERAQRHNALPAYTQQLQRTCHTQPNVHRTIPRTTKQTSSGIHKSTAHTAPSAAHTARTHATTYTPSILQERAAERSDTPKTNANVPHSQIYRTHKCTAPNTPYSQTTYRENGQWYAQISWQQVPLSHHSARGGKPCCGTS